MPDEGLLRECQNFADGDGSLAALVESVGSRVYPRVSMVPSVESGCRGGRKHPLPGQPGPACPGSISYINSVRATFSVSCVRDDLWRGCSDLAWTSKHTPENMYAYFYAASS